MRDYPPDDPTQAFGHTSIAWPLELLYHERDEFAGYLMIYIQNAVPILEVFNPRLRARTLPGFNWRYLHRTARNLAVSLEALHKRGYVIGDVNESNVMVTPTAMVTLIDTDSFQVQVGGRFRRKPFPCPVGKPEYTPPELQGRSLHNTRRYAEHDYFGLGVLVFQLLLDGSHPFRAQWDGSGDPPPIEERIRCGAFPYMDSPSLPVQPPRYAPKLDTLHPDVANLVQRCFVDGHKTPRKRPTPTEWEMAISGAEKALETCPKGHYHSIHLSVCPQCARGIKPVLPQAAGTRSTVARRAPSRSAAGRRVVSPPPAPQPLVRQQPSSAGKGIPGTIAAAFNRVPVRLRGTATRSGRGVMGGAVVGALVWAAGGVAFGAIGGAIAGVIGQGLLWALLWALIWACGWWAFGEVLGETIGGRALGKSVGIGGAIVGAVVGGGLGWAIGQNGIEEVSSWAIVEAILQMSANAAGARAVEGLVGAALIGVISGALVWGTSWAIVGTIGGAIGWRTMGGHTLGEGFGRVPSKVYGTVWALAGAIEGATAGAILGVAVGAVAGVIAALMGRMISFVPIRVAAGAVAGGLIGELGGSVAVEYVGGIDEKLGRVLRLVEALVGFTVGLLVATGTANLWASGETSVPAASDPVLTGLVGGAMVGAIGGALFGAFGGAIVRAADI